MIESVDLLKYILLLSEGGQSWAEHLRALSPTAGITAARHNFVA